MKKYSKEQLAADISDQITFEDCTCYIFNEEVFDYENCGVIFSGWAVATERKNGDWSLYELQFDYIRIDFEDDYITIFNGEELREMESLVKLWN